MNTFHSILAEIKRDCGWEHVPLDKVSALAKLCGPAEIDCLIQELESLDDSDLEGDAGDVGDEYWRLRTAYSQALAEIGEPAIEPLIQALSSQSPSGRAYAARALGLIGTTRAFSPIVAQLAREEDGDAKLLMIEALGGIGGDQAVEVLLPYLTTPQQQNRGWIVRVAANALGRIGAEAVIQPLAEILSADLDWLARLGAAEALRKIKDQRVAGALRKALKDEDPRVKAEAVAGLRELR
jgi:HEAT repeat protein